MMTVPLNYLTYETNFLKNEYYNSKAEILRLKNKILAIYSQNYFCGRLLRSFVFFLLYLLIILPF